MPHYAALIYSAGLIAALCASVAMSARAEEPDCSDNVVTLQVENDLFSPWSNDDSHYTNGLRLSLVTPLEDDCLGLGRQAQGVAAWFAPEGTTRTTERISYSIGQSMFTPEDTDTRELVVDDRPYAGWLYVGLAYQANYERANGSTVQDTLALELGIVGPWALGEEVQNGYHDLLGIEKVNGWDNQLKNEPGLNVTLDRKWRTAQATPFPGTSLSVDAIPFVHANLGNVLTAAGVGTTLRIGQGLRHDFGPPRIRPGQPGSEAFTNDGGFAWYLFAGAEGQLVLHNIFLDGNTFRDSHDVDRNLVVGDFQAGFAVIYESWRFTYTHVLRTHEFDEQDEVDQFGALTASFRF